MNSDWLLFYTTFNRTKLFFTFCKHVELFLECPRGVVRTEHFGRQPVHQLMQMFIQNSRL